MHVNTAVGTQRRKGWWKWHRKVEIKTGQEDQDGGDLADWVRGVGCSQKKEQR